MSQDSNQTNPAEGGANRRSLLRGIGLSIGTAGLTAMAMQTAAADTPAGPLEPQSAATLAALTAKLAALPRRRDFKTVPMILTSPSQWDSEALNAVIAYRGGPKQVWDNTVIESPWLNLMRNSLNAQIWSWKHPDFLAVSATHGTAHLALYDEMIWDKYKLSDVTKGKFATNTLINVPAAASVSASDFNNPAGAFSPADNSITVLQRRGVVFIGCHNAIWEFSGGLLKNGVNPDNLSHGALAAELTNHLIEGVVLSPGVVGTLPELQKAGFAYAA
ncbi:transcriptional initiation protein Tat [Acidocella sp.]|uniref:thiosulfate dehydrogenase n=1 Tax=Acidocella sp. TaxID=50710 RepID=UPI0026188E7C|nr:transcriptional initiation protein Tat [Acidocella sp.]MDD2795797.1 transcriptional initiation protein Tat [Acidocella sp.]